MRMHMLLLLVSLSLGFQGGPVSACQTSERFVRQELLPLTPRIAPLGRERAAENTAGEILDSIVRQFASRTYPALAEKEALRLALNDIGSCLGELELPSWKFHTLQSLGQMYKASPMGIKLIPDVPVGEQTPTRRSPQVTPRDAF